MDGDSFAALRDSHDRCRFIKSNIQAVINKLDEGNGFDELYSNYLKYLNSLRKFYLTRFLDSCLMHRLLPQPLLMELSSLGLKINFGDCSVSGKF